jgi:hypothetical protein
LAIVWIRLNNIPSLSSFGILYSLEYTSLLERLFRILLLQMIGMRMFNSHSRSIKSGMRDNLDGSFVGNDRLNPMLCPSCRYSFGAHRTNTKCHHADGSTDSHATEYISLSGMMRCVESIEVPFDDLTFLASVVNGWCCHRDTDCGNSEGQGNCAAGNCSGGRSTRN